MSITQTDIDLLPASAVDSAHSPRSVSEIVDPPTGGPTRETVPPELARILHVRVPIIVRLAERNLSVGTVLRFNIGSILEFDRRADAELELLVNNRVIGRGAPVKVGENFGLRLSAIGNLASTIHALGA